MMVPVISGTGEWIPLDTDDMPRLTTAEVLTKACEDIDSRLWDLFAEATSVVCHPGDRRGQD